MTKFTILSHQWPVSPCATQPTHRDRLVSRTQSSPIIHSPPSSEYWGCLLLCQLQHTQCRVHGGEWKESGRWMSSAVGEKAVPVCWLEHKTADSKLRICCRSTSCFNVSQCTVCCVFWAFTHFAQTDVETWCAPLTQESFVQGGSLIFFCFPTLASFDAPSSSFLFCS